jgi:hypothetical protein
MNATQRAEQAEAIKMLRKWLKPGDTVYTVLRHVSKSGMSRRIDLYKITKDGPLFLTGYAARAIDSRWDCEDGGIIVGGCGMDMGFHLVYTLGRVLFPKGFKVGRKGTHARNGDKSGHDNDGGYALNHCWL